MDNLPHDRPEDLIKRLRALAVGLTNAEDVAAVRGYADEIERDLRRQAQAKRVHDVTTQSRSPK